MVHPNAGEKAKNEKSGVNVCDPIEGHNHQDPERTMTRKDNLVPLKALSKATAADICLDPGSDTPV